MIDTQAIAHELSRGIVDAMSLDDRDDYLADPSQWEPGLSYQISRHLTRSEKDLESDIIRETLDMVEETLIDGINQ